MSNLTNSENLLIRRYGNGIKLVPRESYSSQTNSITALFTQPFNVYFMNHKSEIVDLNDSTVDVCGFLSRNDALGRTTACVAKQETVQFEFAHDQEVLNSNQMIIKDELFVREKDEIEYTCLSIKFPWYDTNNKIQGIFGCSIILNKVDSLASALTRLTQAELLSNSTPSQNKNFSSRIFNGVHLTKREIDCLNLLVLGKTAKHIARTLELSTRTVEHYIFNMRQKLNVSSKSELIDQALLHR